MKITYYTIDDLKKGHDEKGVTGWKLSRFLDRKDALLHYKSIPNTGVKVLGIWLEEQDLDLIRCIPLFEDDKAGEDLLVTDFLTRFEGKEKKLVTDLAGEWVKLLNICYFLGEGKILPAPGPMPENLKGKYLWPNVPGDLESAIRFIHVGGVGWISPAEFDRRYPPQGGFVYPPGPAVPGRWRVGKRRIHRIGGDALCVPQAEAKNRETHPQ